MMWRRGEFEKQVDRRSRSKINLVTTEEEESEDESLIKPSYRYDGFVTINFFGYQMIWKFDNQTAIPIGI